MEYLNKDNKLREDAIELLVCEKMHRLPKNNTLSDESSKFLINLVYMENDPKHPLQKWEGFTEKVFLYELLKKRTEFCFTFKFKNPIALLFLVGNIASPGQGILYLWYIQWWTFKNRDVEDNVIDLLTLCEKIFPWGFFSEDDLHKIWDSQKVSTKLFNDNKGSDNLVDYSVAGNSIQFPFVTK